MSFTSRRNLTACRGVLSAVLLCLVGCGAPADNAEQTTAREPGDRYGGSMTLSTTSDPKSFNPIVAKETSTTFITGFLFEGLVRTNPETTLPEPGLAESWEVSEDGLTWTFRLREGLQWSDGQPITAEDVVFTFEDLVYNPDVPASSRDIFTIDGKEISVSAVDAQTVRFDLPVRFAPFLRAMGQEIMPAHVLRPSVESKTFASTWNLDVIPKDVVSSGAFVLDSYSPGQLIRLKRNPHYWKRDPSGSVLPYLDEVRIVIVQNQDVELLKFQEGEVDTYGLRPSDYMILKPEEAQSDYTIYELGPAFGTSFVFFNLNPGINEQTQQPYVKPYKRAWFENLLFRKAVAHVIDRKSMIDIVFNGLGYPQYAAMSPSAGFFYNPNVPHYDFDLEKARALLTEAGFEDRDGDGVLEDSEGHPIEITFVTNSDNTDRVKIANIIRKDLETLGFKVYFTQLEFNTLVNKLNGTYDWEMMLLGLTGGIEPHFGKNVWHSSGHLHMWNPRQQSPATPWEAEIDAIFTQGVQELDSDKRKVFYDRWQEIVEEELPLIYTVLPPSITAVRNRFGNLNPTPYAGVLHNIEELYILH